MPTKLSIHVSCYCWIDFQSQPYIESNLSLRTSYRRGIPRYENVLHLVHPIPDQNVKIQNILLRRTPISKHYANEFQDFRSN